MLNELKHALSLQKRAKGGEIYFLIHCWWQ